MAATDEAERFWEERYQRSDRIWSGRVNPVMAEIVEPLKPGRVLDLGCGEGGDAVWLARQGWRVTGVDISATALERAAVHVAEAGVAERVTFERHDLATDFPEGEFDLVSAQFLQSPVDFPRDEVLRRAAGAVAVGGVLLIVEHGAAPPWSDHAHADFPTAQETFDVLRLDPARWTAERVDAPEREATGPDGHTGILTDNVIVARRTR
ncbi:methyltransferase domain-containing protein [Actinomadura barringtoniae]|uniref:Methyltransferase domain-containing protein n=1 Tax=Actinomadura barringtoniae TaxID=1427535 RepID=A0A939PDS6_9ACTN|nr:class I SAM-dependent methyltransferase [Actinomadura barringtoniae]MBO2450761.1 methyltransferase domain-containing protein [Actinomadura barringtoniae]